MSADVAIGLTLDDSDYNAVADRADKRLERLGRHNFSGSRAGARNLGKEIEQLGKHADRATEKLTRMQKLVEGSEKTKSVARKIKWGAFGVAALAESGKFFSSLRMKQIKAHKDFDADDAGALLKWQKRRERFHEVAHSAGMIGLASAGVQYGAEGVGLIGKVFGGSKPGGGGLLGRLFGGSAKKGMEETSGAAEGLSRSLSSATGTGSTFAGVLEGIGGIVGKLVIGLTGVGVASVAGIGMLLKSGVGLNADLEEATQQFEIFTGSAAKAKSMVASLKHEADVSPFSTMEVIQSGAALVSMADKSQAKLMDLVKTAERLTVLNPNKAAGGGLESAGIAMKNALSGNYQSLQERFNIAPAQIQAIQAQGKTGLDLIKALLTSLNIGENAVDKMSHTWRGLLSTIESFADTLKQSFAQPFFEWIKGRAEAATGWITQNGQWAINVAKGLGTWVQDKVSMLASAAAPAKAWFNVLMNWVDLLPDKIAAAWQGNKFSAFFSEVGSKVFALAKEVGSLIFDLLVHAGDVVAQKINNAMGVKSADQKFQDKISAEMKGKSSAEITASLIQAQSEAKYGSNNFTRNYAGNKAAAIQRVISGETTLLSAADSDSFSAIMGRHKAGVNSATSGVTGAFSNLVGNTLGGNQAVAAATAGKMGLLDRAAGVGSMPTAGELKDKVANVKQQQTKLANFASGKQSIFAAAAERARRAGVAPGSVADNVFRDQAAAQVAALQQQMFGAAPEDASTPAAAGGNKLAKKAEANNAAAQMRPRNMQIGIAVTSLDGNLHGAYATAP